MDKTKSITVEDLERDFNRLINFLLVQHGQFTVEDIPSLRESLDNVLDLLGGLRQQFDEDVLRSVGVI